MTELSLKEGYPVQNGNKKKYRTLYALIRCFKLNIGYLKSWFALHVFNINNFLDFKSLKRENQRKIDKIIQCSLNGIY